MEKETFALEMLKELKANSKRWFIIAIIELVLLLITNIGWILYNSQFETVAEQTSVDGGENGIATYLEDSESGDINYGENNKD